MPKAYREDCSINGRRAEIDIKVGRVLAALEENGLDALYIKKSEAFAWITAGGNNIITRYVEAGVTAILLTRDGGRYAITNAIEYPRVLEEEKLDQLGFEVMTQPWYESHDAEYVRKIIGEHGVYAADVPMPGAPDANAMIARLQYSLTENEIARYLWLGETFSRELEKLLADVRPGDMELDIVGRINNSLWKLGIDTVLYLVAGDERIYKYRHCIPTENRIKNYMMVSCNARYKGLITKTTRFIHFGKADEALRKQYADTVEIENRMIAATKVGVDDLDVQNLGIAAYEELGYHDMWKVHHQGGPQGYTNGYYLVTKEQHGIVRPSQCYCYNPSITGTKTEDAFIVADGGPLMITKPVSFPELRSTVGGIEFVRPGILEIG